MTMDRNTQIPREAIEGAAGINDKFTLNASLTQVICDEKEKKATKKNTKTIMPNSVSRPVLSTELAEGMTIKATNTPIVGKDR